MTRASTGPRLARVDRLLAGAAVAAFAVLAVACDDDTPSDPPAETPGTGAGGSVTTVPAQTPTGSGPVEPGTNLPPSSGAVDEPPGSGSQEPGLGDSQTTTGG